MGPATSTHFTRVVHVILMLVLHQSDVNFFVDVAGSCVYAAGPNLWTSRIAKTLHGDTGLYPRSPHCGRRGFFSATAAKRSRGDVFRRETVLSDDLRLCVYQFFKV